MISDIDLHIDSIDGIGLSVFDGTGIALDPGGSLYATGIPYRGAYEFTPSQSAQIIPIIGKTALADIIVKPIPQCYGLVSYHGNVLTVS